MRILIDMNLSPRWVDVLADAGIESIHWSSVGEATASDSFIMAFAKGAGYVVLTHNLDSRALLTIEPPRARIRLLPLNPR